MTQTEKYGYPEDKRFRRIAGKIADRCMVYMQEGKEMVPRGSYCPLGAYIGSIMPMASQVSGEGEMRHIEAIAFIGGFEGRALSDLNEFASANERWWRLGYAYRQRYTRVR